MIHSLGVYRTGFACPVGHPCCCELLIQEVEDLIRDPRAGFVDPQTTNSAQDGGTLVCEFLGTAKADRLQCCFFGRHFGFSFLVYAGLGCALLVAIFSFVRSLYLLLFFYTYGQFYNLFYFLLFFLRETNIITVTVLLHLIWALDNLFYYFFLLDFTVYSYNYYDKYQADYKPFTVLHSAHSWLEYGAIMSLFYNEYSGTR